MFICRNCPIGEEIRCSTIFKQAVLYTGTGLSAGGVLAALRAQYAITAVTCFKWNKIDLKTLWVTLTWINVFSEIEVHLFSQMLKNTAESPPVYTWQSKWLLCSCHMLWFVSQPQSRTFTHYIMSRSLEHECMVKPLGGKELKLHTSSQRKLNVCCFIMIICSNLLFSIFTNNYFIHTNLESCLSLCTLRVESKKNLFCRHFSCSFEIKNISNANLDTMFCVFNHTMRSN